MSGPRHRKAEKVPSSDKPHDTSTSGRGRRSKKGGGSRRPADPAYLEKAALFYLQRFATSRAHLTTILARKVARRGLPDGTTQAQADEWIAAVVERMVDLGYVDDAAYARARTRTLLNRGKPRRVIRRALADKGIPEALIDAAIAEIEAETAAPDLHAAIRYARRRRLGPARPPHRQPAPGSDARDRQYQKDLAALARAGFSYDIAKTVLDLDGEDALDGLERTVGETSGLGA